MNSEQKPPADEGRLVRGVVPLLPEAGQPWVCPWGICGHADAQHCRSMNGNSKMTRGCGSRFAPGTTLEQAKAMIGRGGA